MRAEGRSYVSQETQMLLSERCDQTHALTLVLMHKFGSCLLTPCLEPTSPNQSPELLT